MQEDLLPPLKDGSFLVTMTDVSFLIFTPSSTQALSGTSRCETECECKFSDKEWSDILWRTRTATCSASGRETLLKITHYWYYTPRAPLGGKGDLTIAAGVTVVHQTL